MIKHRFILREADDFRIFAAIPCERTVLTWKKWMRPPDWDLLKTVVSATMDSLRSAVQAFADIGSGADQLLEAAHKVIDGGEGIAKLIERMDSHRDWASVAMSRVQEDLMRLAFVFESLPPPENDRTQDLFDRSIEIIVRDLQHDVDPDNTIRTLRDGYQDHVKTLTDGSAKPRQGLGEVVKLVRKIFTMFVAQLETINSVLQARLDTARMLKNSLCSSDPLPDTPCPPGVPFAAYTVEFGDVVVSVVEGHAWVSSRATPPEKIEQVKQEMLDVLRGVAPDVARSALEKTKAKLEAGVLSAPAFAAATDDERRVVEIVTQMLTERSLNPKADTRVPVREIDPAKAHQTREAEKHDPTPRVRTIKFQVTPPRYLREAAEKILSATHRRAHWVIGHWRDQPYGELHKLRRQTWIKPHIRGLGEASATVASVVAPRPGS